jgi:hypothetical protein
MKMKMEAAGVQEKLEHIYQYSRYQNPEYCNDEDY